MEVWKDILNYEGLYQVSNMGRVRRVPVVRIMRNQSCSWEQYLPEKVLSPTLDSKGYLQVKLVMGSKRVARVHRLVAETLLVQPSAELVEICRGIVPVNHKDGNVLNNSIENLEWCSPGYNQKHAWDMKLKTEVRGESIPWHKLTEDQVLKIYALARNRVMSQERIAMLFGIKQITVSNILRGRSWAWLTGAVKVSRKFSSIHMAEADCH